MSVPRYRGRKGIQNRKTATVRLALHSMKYDAIVEWVKAYRQLDEISTEDANTQLEILKTKFKSLEKLFEHMFPKVKELEQSTIEEIEMEALEAKEEVVTIEEQPTSALLESLNESETKN